jgi:hypothetical protein
MEVKYLEALATDGDAVVDEVAASCRPPREVAAVWIARADPERARPGDEAVPRMRRRKATRCRHCAFCHPRGDGGGIRTCVSPDRADLVIGDQMACGSFTPVTASPA